MQSAPAAYQLDPPGAGASYQQDDGMAALPPLGGDEDSLLLDCNDIDVNALTVSVTDDDAAVVLQGSSSLTPTEAKTYLEVESVGCRDPRIFEYNQCVQASSCMGVCSLNSVTVSDTMGTETLTAGAAPAATRQQGQEEAGAPGAHAPGEAAAGAA